MGGQQHSARVSVCMATYDGAPFVVAQLESILAQLGPRDEVVVVDDCSRDQTPALVAGLGDPRVHLHANPRNTGHVQAFARAMELATGDVLFLADQDDLWPAGRVDAMLRGLAVRPVVAGNLTLFGTREGPHRQQLRAAGSGSGLANLLGILAGRRPYFGSAMAVRRDLLGIALPIPRYVESHDVWLAIVGNLTGGVEHLEQPVLLRRLHGANLTAPRRRSLDKVAAARLGMLRSMVEVGRRVAQRRRSTR